MVKGGAQEAKDNFANTFEASACIRPANIPLNEVHQWPKQSRKITLYPALKTNQVLWVKQHQWDKEDGGVGMEGVNI